MLKLEDNGTHWSKVLFQSNTSCRQIGSKRILSIFTSFAKIGIVWSSLCLICIKPHHAAPFGFIMLLPSCISRDLSCISSSSCPKIKYDSQPVATFRTTGCPKFSVPILITYIFGLVYIPWNPFNHLNTQLGDFVRHINPHDPRVSRIFWHIQYVN